MQAPPDLPIELVMAILRLAARHAALHDRTWLCVLARTSRFVWSLVLPILYETVSVTPHNAGHIVATVQSSSRHWLLTKNLYLADDSESFLPDVPAFAGAFSGVQHVICDIELLKRLLHAHAGFRPTRFTCTSMFQPTSWTTPEFSGITHLRMATDELLSLFEPPPLSGALTHVVVQMSPGCAAEVLRWFFASPTVQRVAVWEKPHSWTHPSGAVPLSVFARAHLDGRIRLIGAEEHALLLTRGTVRPVRCDMFDSAFSQWINPDLPDVLTFDPALWEIGKEVQWSSDSHSMHV